MPQSIAVWCEQSGHDVRYVCYTGCEDIVGELARDTDVLFVGAFTLSAFTAYAVSAIYRREGAVTVLGGPHARCFPEDAAKHFDPIRAASASTRPSPTSRWISASSRKTCAFSPSA